jgi:hypothetical protein
MGGSALGVGAILPGAYLESNTFCASAYSIIAAALRSGGITCDYDVVMTNDLGRSPGQKFKDVTRRMLQVGVSCTFVFFSVACSAVYPEMQTAVRPLPDEVEPDPPPADDLFFIYFEGAWIPAKDQGGLPWPGGAPDPFAKLIVDDTVLFQTPVESRTREPTWKGQDKENHRIHPDSRVYIEVWDNNTMTDMPLCRVRVRSLRTLRDGGENEFW